VQSQGAALREATWQQFGEHAGIDLSNCYAKEGRMTNPLRRYILMSGHHIEQAVESIGIAQSRKPGAEACKAGMTEPAIRGHHCGGRDQLLQTQETRQKLSRKQEMTKLSLVKEVLGVAGRTAVAMKTSRLHSLICVVVVVAVVVVAAVIVAVAVVTIVIVVIIIVTVNVVAIVIATAVAVAIIAVTTVAGGFMR
jgi:hypothetical protein